MMKLKGVVRGRETVMFGLSRRNLQKFLDEMNSTYIQIKAEEMGLPFDIVIFSGETEADMYRQFKPGITPETEVTISDKLDFEK